MQFFGGILVGFLTLAAASARADVIVLANRTPASIQALVQPQTGAKFNVSLQPADVTPLFIDGRAGITFPGGGAPKHYELDANCAYYFGRSKEGPVDLQKIGLGENTSTINGRPLPGRPETTPSVVIPVKLLVDEEEPARRAMWEHRLRDRIAAASAVLDKYCRVQLKVVAVDTWNSDNATTDFFDSLAEFERKVNPFPGRLAIGFTSQYQAVTGRVHMAGTRGTLHTHILVREWSRSMTESDRVEMLVHELGHLFGAAHSPEPNSIMRPVLGNQHSDGKNFEIRFDPVNTLVMAMIGEEIRRRKIQSVASLSPGTKLRLSQIYKSLSPTLPDDPAAGQLNQMVAKTTVQPIVTATKQILATIDTAARENLSRPAASDAKPGETPRREGDALTEYYVRQAAGIAQFLPDTVAPSAFMLGLGIALDNGDSLRRHSQYGSFVQLIESDRERSLRHVFMGEPTIYGRRDLAQQFILSAYLAALGGTQTAQDVVINHELALAKRPKGFSFANVAAGRAGVMFAGGVMNHRFRLADLAENFSLAAYLPPMDGLAEKVSAADLAAQFGDANDERFRSQLRAIDQRVLQLPAYRGVGIASER